MATHLFSLATGNAGCRRQRLFGNIKGRNVQSNLKISDPWGPPFLGTATVVTTMVVAGTAIVVVAQDLLVNGPIFVVATGTTFESLKLQAELQELVDLMVGALQIKHETENVASSKRCYIAEEISKFLKKIGFHEETTIYIKEYFSQHIYKGHKLCLLMRGKNSWGQRVVNMNNSPT
ncbi:hypothetical protein Fot_24219 [Forsythia ovata]|uniref:Uncharacterized protein n=1 Tax=Forsythia ovata TaxID=205694 RepID=A0ABD1U5M0_9LAMI